MDRRQFLQAGLAVAGTAALAAADTKKEAAVPIVDTHQHLWDLKKFKLPWVKEGSPLARTFDLDDYRKATEGLNVVKTVYMEVDVDPSQQDAEADYVIGLCKDFEKTKMAGAVISGRPASDGFKKYVSRFKGSKQIKGIRQVLHNEANKAGYCLQPAFVKGIQLLGDLGLSFDLCLRPGELLDAARLIDECPGTRFILDHCGNANVQAKDRTQWQKDIGEVAKRKNVVCKVSGIVASAKPGAWSADDLAPIVKHVQEVFGPDRVMFGGDWPVCTLAASYKQWVEALKTIVKERKEEEQKKLFHDNAVKFYGLA
ncbi:MAG TPA: amidohydrolase family protein [Gemmataceae bacterium]|nr:amidohydrolase family protein [Gemmataceae bacterium]